MIKRFLLVIALTVFIMLAIVCVLPMFVILGAEKTELLLQYGLEKIFEITGGLK